MPEIPAAYRIPMNEPPDSPVIEAAGGILWRATPRGPEIVLIHRERYDDWTLPKGKREPGETWQETALREVREETGLRAELAGFAGAMGYTVQGRPKVVLYWKMHAPADAPFNPDDEVDALRWLPVDEALARMTYPDEAALVKKVSVAHG